MRWKVWAVDWQTGERHELIVSASHRDAAEDLVEGQSEGRLCALEAKALPRQGPLRKIREWWHRLRNATRKIPASDHPSAQPSDAGDETPASTEGENQRFSGCCASSLVRA